jgi:hypothetical protein
MERLLGENGVVNVLLNGLVISAALLFKLKCYCCEDRLSVESLAVLYNGASAARSGICLREALAL